MSNQQYPQQPHNPYNQPYPQQWGAPQPPAPQPPKKRSVGKTVGLGCLGIIGLFVAIAIVAAIAGGGNDTQSKSSGSGNVKPPASASASKTNKPAAADSPKAASKKSSNPKAAAPKPKAKTVVFKVWGTAPAGALGPLDITYGSDSDNRKGTFHDGKFTATLPLNKDAMYYDVSAQLQGSGDIQCSVTVDGKTKKGHASGDYNICSAQLSGGLFGGWE